MNKERIFIESQLKNIYINYFSIPEFKFEETYCMKDM